MERFNQTHSYKLIYVFSMPYNFDDYIAILRYLWNVIESNPIYKAIITKDMLCTGWDGKVVKEVMNALNDGE